MSLQNVQDTLSSSATAAYNAAQTLLSQVGHTLSQGIDYMGRQFQNLGPVLAKAGSYARTQLGALLTKVAQVSSQFFNASLGYTKQACSSVQTYWSALPRDTQVAVKASAVAVVATAVIMTIGQKLLARPAVAPAANDAVGPKKA